jgi:hypothetical protein
MRRIVMSLLVIGSLVYTTSAWEATTSQNVQIAVTSGSSSLLPADRDASANWKMAGMLSVGGIPNRTTQCGATINPIGGGANDTTNIQNAINACPAGQMVQLGIGSFTISEGSYILLTKGITVRGAGPGSTVLTRTGGAKMGSYIPGSNPTPMFFISPVDRYVDNAVTGTALTADAAVGSYSIQVASTSGLSVGQIVLLDELSGAGWQPDIEGRSTSIWASPDYRVTFHQHNPTCCNDDGNDVKSAYTVNTDRMNNELKQIASISGNTVTFDSPVMISYRTSHTAELWHFATPFLRNAGVENLTTEYPDSGSVIFQDCAYCWAYRVENRYYLNPSFGIYTSFRTQLDQYYVHEAAWPVPGGAGYNIDLRYDSSEALIINGISVLANKVMVARGSGSGSVVAYNYMDKGYINGSAWQEMGLNASHLVGPHHVLFEGNWGFNGDSDQTHGNSTNMTFFRNWLTGVRSTFTGLDGVVQNDSSGGCKGGGPMRATGPQAYGWWFSFVGNVLGSPCTTSANGWRLNGSNQLNPDIFQLGWDDQTNGFTDPNVTTIYPAVGPNCSASVPNCATIVDGNYDYFRNQVTWASNDTAHTLPNSLFLPGMPAFFNAGSGYTWPWVDPVGSTKTYSLPAKARYDAGTPFTQP